MTKKLCKKETVLYTKMINGVSSYLKNYSSPRLEYDHLDENSSQIYAFSDATLAKNYGRTSQFGYFIFLLDNKNSCHLFY